MSFVRTKLKTRLGERCTRADRRNANGRITRVYNEQTTELGFTQRWLQHTGRDTTKGKRDLRLKPNYAHCSTRTCTLTGVYVSYPRTLFTRRNADATARNSIRVRAKLSTFAQTAWRVGVTWILYNGRRTRHQMSYGRIIINYYYRCSALIRNPWTG